MKKIFTLIILFLIFTDLILAQSTYIPVDNGSTVHFVIRNFGIKTGGDFYGLKGTIHFNPADLNASSFDVTVDAKTLDTDNSSRDAHLRKTDYFNVEKFNVIQIKSTKVAKSTIEGRFYIFANLTIKGITKPIEFSFAAIPKDGGLLFDGEFDINRRDFAVGSSSISMSDNLTVSLSVFAKK